MISAGNFRWEAQVLKAPTTTDLYGRRDTTFTNGVTVRADLREVGGVEQAYAEGVAVVENYEVRLRWPNVARASLTTLDRLVIRGKTLRITSIRNLGERDRVAVLDCVEVT